MECIFLDSDKMCEASDTNCNWKVDEETLKELCNGEDFRSCHRYKAFMELQEKSSTLKVEKE